MMFFDLVEEGRIFWKPWNMPQEDMEVDEDVNIVAVVKKRKKKRTKSPPPQVNRLRHQQSQQSPQPQQSQQPQQPQQSQEEPAWKTKSYDGGLWTRPDDIHGPTSFSHSASLSSLNRFASAPLRSSLSSHPPSPTPLSLPSPAYSTNQYLPQVISAYIQLAVNVSVLLMLVGTLGYIFWVIKKDVDMKVEVYVADAMNEMQICRRNFEENKCAPPHRIPAMETQCNAWAACMERNPFLVGRAKLSAQTVSEAINGFVEPISFKTMLFMFLVVVGFVVVSNLGFWMTRVRPVPQHPPMSPSPLQMHPQESLQFAPHSPYGTPHSLQAPPQSLSIDNPSYSRHQSRPVF